MKRKKWTPRDLAARSGVHITLVRRYFGEYGDKPVQVGAKNAPRIAKALGVSISSLLYGTV